MSVHCTGVVNDSGKKITVEIKLRIFRKHTDLNNLKTYWYMSNILL